MIELPRRSFLTGLASLIVAPAIVKASSLMPVKSFKPLRSLGSSIIYMSNPISEDNIFKEMFLRFKICEEHEKAMITQYKSDMEWIDGNYWQA